MKKLDTLCDATAKKIVQHTLQSAMEGGPECPHTWFYPVSYTHLDVYKRQLRFVMRNGSTTPMLVFTSKG